MKDLLDDVMIEATRLDPGRSSGRSNRPVAKTGTGRRAPSSGEGCSSARLPEAQLTRNYSLDRAASSWRNTPKKRSDANRLRQSYIDWQLRSMGEVRRYGYDPDMRGRPCSHFMSSAPSIWSGIRRSVRTRST
jgi:hypothetical protein